MRGTNWLIVVLALASTGCTALDLSPRRDAAKNANMDEYFAVRLQAGREHLNRGNITKAIEAFRQASYNSRTAPEALNGMGVAYSKLGRNDVARSLFERAIEKDPTDQRYWRNLARVDEQIMLANSLPAAEGRSEIAPLKVASPPVIAEAKVPVSASRVQAATLRTARARETLIKTSVSDGRTTASTPESVTKKLAGRPVGVAVAATPTSSEYPIRIKFTSANKPATATRRSEGRQAYPIRIAFDTQ